MTTEATNQVTAPTDHSTTRSLQILWKLFRPHTLTASFIPVLTGTTLGWKTTGHLHWPLLAAMLVASTLIQAATNMFNEYFDFLSGLDNEQSIGIAGAITQEGISPRTVLYTAITAAAVAGILGIYICALTSWWLVWIGAISMLVGYLYTGGPYPISATPFGELFAGGFMGSGIILISCFIQRKSLRLEDLLISIPAAVLIGAILTANNIRDLKGDKENGRRTLAILLGHKWAVRFLACCMVSANLWIVALVTLHVVSPWALLALGSLVLARTAIGNFHSEDSPAQMMIGMTRVAQTNTLFGALLVIGLLVG